jgi:hypothetical protein
MNIRWIEWGGALLLLAGCSHTISGAYVAHGEGFVGMIQITQTSNGQLLGTLSYTVLKSNGSLDHDTIALTGAADGNSLTLVAKSPIPFFPSLTLSGTIDHGVITLTNPSGTAQLFTTGRADDYQSAVQQLSARGGTIQHQQHLADINATVLDLNKRLVAYATMVQSPQATKDVEAFHAAHANAMGKAQRGWTMEQRYPRRSLQANEVYLDINQVAMDLSTYDLEPQQVPERGRTHLQEFDMAIARSPCRQDPDPALTNCLQQPEAIKVYEAGKVMVQKRMDDIKATLARDNAAMKAIVDQARAYQTR